MDTYEIYQEKDLKFKIGQDIADYIISTKETAI